MSRLRADFWVAATLRRYNGEGASAVLRRRGAAEAGAIFVLIDRLDGTANLYGPAPQSEMPEHGEERRFARVHAAAAIPLADAEKKLAREMAFDPDLWIVEIEDREARLLFDVAAD